ncbi:lytic transglycosylase domain-containing protein [Spirosoma taeanense]|uniref:lytic transglycosylase domain-containing protein n=1 Tax=Spirosoma taeanense TaxID=2735870 RepID=UPI001F04273F|nr:lytic transglycosylase domain-containing protein [Spirosoma taeanense]
MLAVGLLIPGVSAQRKKASEKPGFTRSAIPAPRLVGGPGRLHFSGELVPTQQSDVSAKLAFALASSSGYSRHLNALKARSAPFFAVIEPILRKHNIPNDFKYLPLIESAWQANAVSSAGAIGYWQFMDETAQDMGLSITPGNDERTDLRKSTEAACRYLAFLHRKLGSWTLVAAAYNGGIGMVQRKIVRSGHRDYYAMAMNPETGYYLYRILAMKELFTNPVYGAGPTGPLMASAGNWYEQEREQARRMGWLHDEEPDPVGVPVESLETSNDLSVHAETAVMDSVLAELLKTQAAATPVYTGDVTAKLVRAGQLKIGQSWTFKLTEDILIGEDELKAGDVLYALVDDIDSRGQLFLRATKAVSAQTNTVIPLTLLAINPKTGLAGVSRPKPVKPGWVVQWKL